MRKSKREIEKAVSELKEVTEDDAQIIQLPSKQELRVARERAGLTRKELADRMGKSKGFIKWAETDYDYAPNTGWDNVRAHVEELNAALSDSE